MLAGKTTAVSAKKDSTLIFSVSRVESPQTAVMFTDLVKLHRVIRFEPER
jgi:hypothetical protein